jgi:diguanylate cyclase (GGDEF)-like protein
MQSVTRPYDAIGRYGGEEFLVILPGCDSACTANQAERMRAALANEAMSINERPHLVTCSFGATCWRPGMDSSTDALIRIADSALYMAKGQGRDRVVSLP